MAIIHKRRAFVLPQFFIKSCINEPLVNYCYYAFKNALINNKIQQCINMYKVELHTDNLHCCREDTVPHSRTPESYWWIAKTMKNRVVRDEAPGEGKFQL